MGAGQDIVLVALARTPFGKLGGALRDVPAVDLAVHAVRAVYSSQTGPLRTLEAQAISHSRRRLGATLDVLRSHRP
jgi:acetyl-CoA acetyltransferase